MQIKRETDYAIRSVLYLCGLKENGTAMVDEISRAMHIPKSFTAKILQKLVRSGIILSYQGVNGGFSVAKKPAEITLLDVFVAIEGPLALNVCLESGKGCDLSSNCRVHPFWFRIRDSIESTFRDLTFDMFLEKK